MRKFILLVCILFISGCSINEDSSVKEDDTVIEDNNVIDEVIEEEYADSNEVRLGLFLYDNNYRNKERIEDTYYADFVSGSDIGSFEVFLTDDSVIDGYSFKNAWYKYYNEYEDISNVKIGYNIKFILEDGTSYSGNYFEPDTYRFGEYFYTYLYDDVNVEDGVMYSHLESIEDNTLITSIKIYAVDGIDKVENIILSAFTYDGEDDFDEEGNYRGDSIYVIRIKRK